MNNILGKKIARRSAVILTIAAFTFQIVCAQDDSVFGFAPEATFAQRKNIKALYNDALDKGNDGSNNGSTRSREILGYSYQFGENGVKQDCNTAQKWWNMASTPSKRGGPSVVMGYYYSALNDAVGCPIHHYRNSDLARRLWTLMLNDPKLDPDLRKIIQHDLELLAKNTDPEGPPPGLDENGKEFYPTDKDLAQAAANADMTKELAEWGVIAMVGIALLAPCISGNCPPPPPPGKLCAPGRFPECQWGH